MHWAVLALCLVCLPGCLSNQPTLNVDWAQFLARSDLVFEWNSTSSQPNKWYYSMFGGNGNLGFMLWFPSPSLMHVDISRIDVYDDRTPDMPEYIGNFVFDQPRLPIGHFEVPLPGVFLQASGRTVLYDGVSYLTIQTSSGNVTVEVFANAAWQYGDVIVLTTSNNVNASFVPEPGDSTWSSPKYVNNPAPVISSSVPRPLQTQELVVQSHLKGSAHCTGILSNDTSVIVTITAVSASPAVASAIAVAELTKAQSSSLDQLKSFHSSAWHAFWETGGGFITMTDGSFESFWYVQLFKFACSTRPGGVVHDLQGAWFVAHTIWPDLHWDMNLQQTYVLPMTANRIGLSSTIVDFMHGLLISGVLERNVPTEWQNDSSAAAPTGASSLTGQETCYWSYGPNCTTSPPSVTGNLLWVIQVVHLHALYSGNASVSTDVVWPLLTRALSAYLHFQLVYPDGSIHLPPTYSPEYPGHPERDANYDLSLYRWGLGLAVQLADQYNLTHPYLSRFADTLSRLTLFSIDQASGTYEIYSGVPYSRPHRHYSHLFMIWPLHLTDLNNATWRGIAERSVDLWLATPELNSMFYRPVASKMNVLFDRKAAAHTNISILLMTRVKPNTFYNEGEDGSCTETPYAAAWAIGELLVQSWNRSIDFFPGVEDTIVKDSVDAPSLMRTAQSSFFNLRTEGAFLASARRYVAVDNETHLITGTDFVSVTSTTASTVIIRTTMSRPLSVLPVGTPVTELGNGYVSTQISADATIVLFSAARPISDFSITPEIIDPSTANFWGFPSKR